MDRAALVHKRKKRYMAQALDYFDAEAAPHLPPDVADAVKGIFRRKMHALALDACEVISLKPGEELNGAIIELRDHMHVEGRPIQRSTTT
jgi:hypothetical protein